MNLYYRNVISPTETWKKKCYDIARQVATMQTLQWFVDRSRDIRRAKSATKTIRFMSKTHYEVLGVEKTASSDDIRKAFLDLSKQLHPDVNTSDPETHEKFVKVNEAYTTLSKPGTRKQYDRNLVARVYSQHAGRSMYGTHVHDSTNRPGHNYEYGDGEERIFWDETIWHMRDRQKDGEYRYKDGSYYGVRGMKRLPNSYIMAGCVGIMMIGAMIHYFAVKTSRDMHKKVLDAKDKKHHAIYTSAKTQARTHGNDLQLTLLKARLMKEKQLRDEPTSTKKD